MKTIYTSNFARHSQSPNAIAISCTVPEWYSGARNTKLAPVWDIVGAIKKKEITQEQYNQFYIELLNERGLTPKLVLDMIPDNSILLCYEAPGQNCHRRLLAEWIEEGTGVVIPEWMNKKEEGEDLQNKKVDSIVEF